MFLLPRLQLLTHLIIATRKNSSVAAPLRGLATPTNDVYRRLNSILARIASGQRYNDVRSCCTCLSARRKQREHSTTTKFRIQAGTSRVVIRVSSEHFCKSLGVANRSPSLRQYNGARLHGPAMCNPCLRKRLNLIPTDGLVASTPTTPNPPTSTASAGNVTLLLLLLYFLLLPLLLLLLLLLILLLIVPLMLLLLHLLQLLLPLLLLPTLLLRLLLLPLQPPPQPLLQLDLSNEPKPTRKPAQQPFNVKANENVPSTTRSNTRLSKQTTTSNEATSSLSRACHRSGARFVVASLSSKPSTLLRRKSSSF